MIAQECEVPVSLVHYYFEKKDNFVKLFNREFVNNIDIFIYKQERKVYANALLAAAVMSRIYYEILLADVNNRRMYIEALKRESNYRTMREFANSLFRKYIISNRLPVSKDQFTAYMLLDFGGRRELLLSYDNDDVNISIQELVTIMVGMMPRLLKLDQAMIDSILLDSNSFFESLDYSNLRYLI